MGSLLSMLDLPISEQETRGLIFTPREIAQQPRTWLKTLQIFEAERLRIQDFLHATGVTAALEERPIVMLVGAGTSDYIGWMCEPQ